MAEGERLELSNPYGCRISSAVAYQFAYPSPNGMLLKRSKFSRLQGIVKGLPHQASSGVSVADAEFSCQAGIGERLKQRALGGLIGRLGVDEGLLH